MAWHEKYVEAMKRTRYVTLVGLCVLAFFTLWETYTRIYWAYFHLMNEDFSVSSGLLSFLLIALCFYALILVAIAIRFHSIINIKTLEYKKVGTTWLMLGVFLGVYYIYDMDLIKEILRYFNLIEPFPFTIYDGGGYDRVTSMAIIFMIFSFIRFFTTAFLAQFLIKPYETSENLGNVL